MRRTALRSENTAGGRWSDGAHALLACLNTQLNDRFYLCLFFFFCDGRKPKSIVIKSSRRVARLRARCHTTECLCTCETRRGLAQVRQGVAPLTSPPLLHAPTRELCDHESMTQSVSSASSLDSHAPSDYSGQSQGARWEEQQKVLALEQLCGVFRVDLGHMRSLRLFFR